MAKLTTRPYSIMEGSIIGSEGTTTCHAPSGALMGKIYAILGGGNGQYLGRPVDMAHCTVGSAAMVMEQEQ